MSSFARAVSASLIAIASLATASAGGATTHHRHATTRHHAETRHHGSTRTTKKNTRHADKATAKHGAAPAGVTSIPSGGLKVYCAGRSNPLLVRKFNQGSGTTVTVLCR